MTSETDVAPKAIYVDGIGYGWKSLGRTMLRAPSVLINSLTEGRGYATTCEGSSTTHVYLGCIAFGVPKL